MEEDARAAIRKTVLNSAAVIGLDLATTSSSISRLGDAIRAASFSTSAFAGCLRDFAEYRETERELEAINAIVLSRLAREINDEIDGRLYGYDSVAPARAALSPARRGIALSGEIG